jgi:hypothetical protein
MAEFPVQGIGSPIEVYQRMHKGTERKRGEEIASANGAAKVSLENLWHFQCDYCQGWWSIGDYTPPPHRQIYCPHCGLQNTVPERVLTGKDFRKGGDRP